jgi:uncharacterized protein YjdB
MLQKTFAEFGRSARSWRRRAAVAFAAALIGGACTQAVDPVPVASISLAPAGDSVEIGQDSQGFIATLRDAGGKTLTGRTIGWSSANEAIATVDASGRVRGVAVGQTFITAEVDGRSATANIKVIIPLAQIVLNPDSLDVPLTTSKLLVASLIGPNGEAITGRTITWSSANPAIATVNGGGIVSAVTLGNTTVTAAAGSKSATAKVHISGEPVAQVRITPPGSVQVVRLGQTFQLSAVCLNAAGSVLPGLLIDWTTGNPSVATVSGGLVTAHALGTATIMAGCGSRSVQSVAITPNGAALFVGGQQVLQATAKDSANNVLSLQGRFVNWTSDNLIVANVSQGGIVSAFAQGTANIEVSVDGIQSPPIVVTVSNVPVATVQVQAPVNPANVKVNNSMQLSLTLRDASGNTLSPTNRTVTWTSSNPAVASVSINGLVTGQVVGGPVTITATCEGQSGSIQITVVP